MTLVGVSLVLADVAGTSPAKFWKRIGLIVACALAASIGSYLVFPRTYIYFGILHCIAVASVLAWPLVRLPRVAFVVGLAIVAAGLTLSHPAFDHRGCRGSASRRANRPPRITSRSCRGSASC